MRIPFLSIFSVYLRLLLFAAGLLLGIQIPAFMTQYEQRVDAHFREVSVNISGFQDTANILFGGDLQALLAYYRASLDPVFSRDANSLGLLVDRYQRIGAERVALEGNGIATALHIAFAADRELLEETLAQYSYTVPLDSRAVQWGLLVAVVLIVVIDLLFFSCRQCGRWLGRRSRRKGSTAGEASS